MATEEDAIWEMSDEEADKAFRDAMAERDAGDSVEEEPEELEEPETESTDDSHTEDDSAEDSDEDEEPEVESEETEEENDNSDEEDTDETEPETEAESPTEKLKYKANGMEFEFTQEEVLDQFGKVFGQSMDYTKKMQTMAPWRKEIAAMEANGVSPGDIDLLIEARSGNKEAIASLLGKSDIDPFDLPEAEAVKDYVPKTHAKSDAEMEINDVFDRIKQDPEYAVTEKVINKDWDDASVKTLAENPSYIQAIHDDVKSGVYDELANRAIKLKMFDGGTKSDLDYYAEAGRQQYEEVQRAAEANKGKIESEANRVKAQASLKSKSASRKAVATPKSRSGKKSVTDYLDDSDEAFDEWYKKVHENL